MAGFAGTRRPQPPGARMATPAALRYAPAVSRRMPVSCWMRRSGQPSRPSAMTCCRFSSLKTLLTSMEGNPSIVLNVLPISIGRFSAVPHWPLLGVPRGVDREESPRSPYGPITSTVRHQASGHSPATVGKGHAIPNFGPYLDRPRPVASLFEIQPITPFPKRVTQNRAIASPVRGMRISTTEFNALHACDVDILIFYE